MNNLKKINVSILAFAAAAALVFTQSAFSSAQSRYYFYDDGTGAKWHSTAPANQTCVQDQQRICSAIFDSMPTSTSNLLSANPDAEEVDLGKLQ